MLGVEMEIKADKVAVNSRYTFYKEVIKTDRFKQHIEKIREIKQSDVVNYVEHRQLENTLDSDIMKGFKSAVGIDFYNLVRNRDFEKERARLIKAIAACLIKEKLELVKKAPASKECMERLSLYKDIDVTNLKPSNLDALYQKVTEMDIIQDFMTHRYDNISFAELGLDQKGNILKKKAPGENAEGDAKEAPKKLLKDQITEMFEASMKNMHKQKAPVL